MTPLVIEARDLRRRFVTGPRRRRRRVDAVAGIDLDVAAGERLAFIGPNGAGKSTSIKMLTGLLHPSSGEARVLGLVPWEERRVLAARIGTLFGQRAQLWQELPPRVSLRMLGAIHRLDHAATERRIDELAELFDGDGLFDQPARTHSLGQRMRCELAACMLHRPELLFLDEPTIGLDLLAKRKFRELLLQLNAELGTTIFLTSHDVADIEQVADRAVVVNHGVVIHDAPVAEMRRQLLAVKQIEIGLAEPLDSEATAWLDASPFDGAVTVTSATGLALHLEVDAAACPVRTVLDRLLALLPVVDVSVVDPPLERVIGEIYERPA